MLQMKCPKDVRPEDYRQMLDTIPKGFVLKSSKRNSYWRDFYFRLERRNTKLVSYGFKLGDSFETAVVCKFK